VWRSKNKDKTNKKAKEYWSENKNRFTNKRKRYYQTNKKRIHKRRIERRTPIQKIAMALRSRLYKTITGKQKKTFSYLGCTREYLKQYIEFRWLDGMNWENYGRGTGRWVIDHVRPCDSFDLSKLEDQEICYHYTNLQPMWWIDNLHKSSKYEKDYFSRRGRSNEQSTLVYKDQGKPS